jgi:hypothetical protein
MGVLNEKRCKEPYFNYDGESKPKYCSLHKLGGMIDIRNKRCIHENCKTQPNYNYEGQTNAVYCSTHKLDGMINIITRTCIHDNCKTQPNYNYDGESKPKYCSMHKLDGMIDIRNKKCIHENCKTIPNYNFEGQVKALYCSSHKKPEMIDVNHKICKTPLCSTRVQNKYDGYCMFCYINLFPDKPVSRNYKTKEQSVVEHIKSNFNKYQWVADKRIQDGCSKRRPDLLLDLGYQVIIIEVDENQHIDYDCSCENKRIMELSQDVGHRPIVFIRFNPDDYNDKEQNITSCWGINGNGVCVIKKSKKNEWNERLSALENQIHYWVNPDNKTNKTIEIIQLFYDI